MSYSDDMNTKAILESISDGLFTVDEHFRVTSFNRAAEHITGIPRKEAIGKPCSEVFRSSMCEEECVLRKTIHSSEPIINHPCYIVDAQGARVPISVSTAVLRNEAGKIIGGAETFRDLTEIEQLRQRLKGRQSMGSLVSHSPVMQPVFELIKAVSTSPSTALIFGETGTGKEVVARTIHETGDRAEGPFIAINCGALPEALLESELFGYCKGAFTGADKDKPGRLALAEGGTLLLDEIGEISPALQVRLLRVLQERVYEPVGGTRAIPMNVRILAATHRDLLEEVNCGRFRKDLFYRINVIRIDLPPLKERKEDIPFLIDHFIHRFNSLQRKAIQTLSPAALSLIMAHSWPGNIRELENTIERAFILCNGPEITTDHLPRELVEQAPHGSQPANMVATRQSAEAQAILTALAENRNHRAKTAAALGIHKTTLFRKMKALGLLPSSH
jgi:PAS domain S-box-containing protein